MKESKPRWGYLKLPPIFEAFFFAEQNSKSLSNEMNKKIKILRSGARQI